MRHLKIYRAIRLIHRTGSIRQAAGALAISPSALNRSVQGFEDQLGFAVFERRTGGVRLTEAGELLLDVIDRHLVSFEDLQRRLGALRDGDDGVLGLSIGSDISAGAALDSLAETEAAFPGVSIDLTFDDTVGSLLQRRVHLALLTNPATDDATEVVFAQPCRLVARQAPSDAPPPRGLWELAEHRVVLPPEGTGARTVLSHLLRRKRLSLPAASALPAASVAPHLRRAAGIAIFPEIAFEDGADPHRTLPLAFGRVDLCALRITGAPLLRPAQAFLGILQKRLGAGPAG